MLDSEFPRCPGGADKEGLRCPADPIEVHASSAVSKRGCSHLWLWCMASYSAASNTDGGGGHGAPDREGKEFGLYFSNP